MAEVDGATLVARNLKKQGVQFMFGIVGFPVGPIATAAQKEGITYVGMRNEQSASYAAQAVGYLTGRPGACLVVSGPGGVHALAGLGNAQQNGSPMILIGGASVHCRQGMGAFEGDIPGSMSRWRSGTRSMAVLARAISTLRTTSLPERSRSRGWTSRRAARIRHAPRRCRMMSKRR